MFCTNCGATLPENSTFCTSCGRPVGSSGMDAGLPPPLPGGVEFVPPETIEVRTGAWISEGWNIVKSDLMNFALMALLLAVVSNVVPIILQGAMVAGMHIVIMKKMVGARTEIGDLFKGFNFFVPTLVASVLISVFVFCGMILCIIPGLVAAAALSFSYLFIVDRKMDFWPAMQASHAVVKKNYVGFTLFIFVAGLIAGLGLLACIVGIFITMPIYFAAITVAYRETVGFASDPAAIQ